MKKTILMIILLNIFLAVFYLNYKNNSLSLQVSDFYYQFNNKKSSDKVVFIEIGEKSINRYGRWPWNRKVLADLIKNINAKTVLLDIVFSESTKDDAYLGNVIGSKPAVCGFFLRKYATQNVKPGLFNILSDSSIDASGNFIGAKYAEINVKPILENCPLNGVLSTFSDKDNIFRHYIVAYTFKDMVFPSLGLQGLRLYFNRDFQIKNNTLYYFNQKIRLNKKNALRLNFYKKYNIISIEDVKKYDLKDKIAIVGISEIGISDIRSTPIGQIPGPLIHYTFVSNILNGDYIKQNSLLNAFVVLLYILLPFVFYRFINSVKLRYVLYFVSLFVFYVSAVLLYKYQNIITELFFPTVYLIINVLIIEFVVFLQKEKKEKFIRDAFSNYLSKDLVEEIINDPDKLKLGGEDKELSILFTDIRSFTTLAEKMSPEAVVTLINSLFSPFSEIIQKNKGMVDKYIGDAIMALFNAPVDVENHAEMACKSALEIMQKLEEINKELKLNIRMGIGINTDNVYVGNMGSEQKFNYTAIGDGVNLASRLESKTKELGVSILISEKTYEKIDKNRFECEYVGEVKVKGKDEKIRVYSLNGFKS
jgi:adenylate cyclase